MSAHYGRLVFAWSGESASLGRLFFIKHFALELFRAPDCMPRFRVSASHSGFLTASGGCGGTPGERNALCAFCQQGGRVLAGVRGCHAASASSLPFPVCVSRQNVPSILSRIA